MRDDVTTLFKDFSYWSEFGERVESAQYHEADYYLKWPGSGNFCMFHGTLK